MSPGDHLGQESRNAGCNRALTRVSGSLLLLLFLLGSETSSAEAEFIISRGFTFKIDPKTPIADLMPPAPDLSAPLVPWLVEGWADVPEVLFRKPLTMKKATFEESADEGNNAIKEAEENTALTIARINHLNQQGTDHFLKAFLERRSDLTGLPFRMGNACRQSKEQGYFFRWEVLFVRSILEQREALKPEASVGSLWTQYEEKVRPLEEAKQYLAVEREMRIAVLMQVLAVEDLKMRRELIKHLAGIDHKEATRALARLAVFSFEQEVRKLALEALRKRAGEESTDILLAGLRYPWPPIAANAGGVIAKLDRKDLVPEMVAVLDEPDPRAPAEREVSGQKTLVVRELVRINHLQSCLLCHPPGNTTDVLRQFAVTGAVPIPGHSSPQSSVRDYKLLIPSPDLEVRADVTYLRQDFSLMQSVKDAAPWPEMQRFDFLVRTRPVTSAEAAAYQSWREEQGPDYLAPHQRAALAALRTLTGRDAVEPTTKAWRSVLKQ